MKLDFDATEEVADYISVPAGTYVCEITDVRVGETRSGDPLWALRLLVAEGEHIGKQAAWDNLVFSTRGRARARQVFGALGLPNQGVVDVDPRDLEGRRVLVEVRPSEFVNGQGQTIRRNEVPYAGYQPVPEDLDGEPPAAANVPF